MQSPKTLAERQRAMYERIAKQEARRLTIIKAGGVFPVYSEAVDVLQAMTANFPTKVRKARKPSEPRRERTATRSQADAEIARMEAFFAARKT